MNTQDFPMTIFSRRPDTKRDNLAKPRQGVRRKRQAMQKRCMSVNCAALSLILGKRSMSGINSVYHHWWNG